MIQEGFIQTFNIEGVEFSTPPQPPIYEIAGYDLPEDEQFFRRTTLPTWWKEERLPEIESKKARLKDKKVKLYINPRCEKFRVQEWNRRFNGYWFMNNGTPTYITGKNYFYLNWCKFDHEVNNGYPVYYDTDRLEFYFTEHCFNNKSCLGYIKIAGRGRGKTTKEVAILLEEMTRTPKRRRAAIQSKTEKDAIMVIFQNKIVPTYKKLPDFFQAVSDSSTNAKSSLSFFKPATRGKEAIDYDFTDEDDELESTILCYSSGEGAIDGETCSIIVQDEIGKTEKVDVNERIDINRFCVYRNNRKVGMILATTTVEEMEKGGANCFKVWKRSNQLEKNQNGFTNSGLYRFFAPSSETTRYVTINGEEICTVDKFGFVNTQITKEYDKNERASKTGSDLSSYIRKNPETADECFYIDNNSCEFDSLILNQRLSYLNTYGEQTRRGLLRFDENNNVEFVDSDIGRFSVAVFPDKEVLNRVSKNGTQFSPMNDHLFSIGGDPIEHGVVIDGRRSNAAAYVFMKFDKSRDDLSETDEQKRPLFYEKENGKIVDAWTGYNFIIEYLGRPNNPVDYFDDMLMLCHWLGAKIHLENQKSQSLYNHFRSKGYNNFIMNRPKETFAKTTNIEIQQNTAGSPASRFMINLYTSELSSFITQHGHRIHFKSLIKDLLAFNALKTTDFDSAVAAGYTLLANKTIAVDRTVEAKPVQYFKEYKRLADGSVRRVN